MWGTCRRDEAERHAVGNMAPPLVGSVWNVAPRLVGNVAPLVRNVVPQRMGNVGNVAPPLVGNVVPQATGTNSLGTCKKAGVCAESVRWRGTARALVVAVAGAGIGTAARRQETAR